MVILNYCTQQKSGCFLNKDYRITPQISLNPGCRELLRDKYIDGFSQKECTKTDKSKHPELILFELGTNSLFP